MSMMFYYIMTKTFKTKNLEDWVEILNNEQVPFSPVKNFKEIVNDPQARVNGFSNHMNTLNTAG